MRREQKDDEQVDPELAAIFNREAANHFRSLNRLLPRLLERPSDRESLQEIRRTVHTLKGSAGMVGFDALGLLAHRMEDLLERLQEGRQSITPERVALLLTATDSLEDLLAGGGDDDSLRRLGQALRDPAAPRCVGPNVPTPAPRLAALPAAPPWVASPPTRPARALRVDPNSVDDLEKLAGELANSWMELGKTYPVSQDHNPSHARFTQLVNEIQLRLKRLRQAPLSSLADRLQRAVQGVARAQNKQIRLVLEGGDVTLDQEILEQLAEPLLHLLRNAAVHGIELPARRQAAGKSETGTICVRAVQEPAQMLLEVHDDGAGVDRAAVRVRAVAAGLMSERHAARMTDAECFQLLFRPGFSTAVQVNELAGRGIGLEIVRTRLHNVGGLVNLSSEPGKGTTFMVLLPAQKKKGPMAPWQETHSLLSST